MEQLLLPTNISLQKGKEPHTAVLTVEPCYPGYGTTIGNALRRVLLSSLPGAAVVAVKISGVDHEFSTLPHVKQDIVQLILNLKQLRMRVFTEETVRLHLDIQGERKVTAKDITLNADVEIVNKDLLLAELTNKDAHLEMDIFVRQGRGYVPIEEREGEAKEVGVIQIDSVFTPVRSVGYRVEDVRVGQKTNYDRLLFNFETDGSFTPQEALRQTTQILLNHFNLLLNCISGDNPAVTVKAEEAETSASKETPTEE